MGNQSRMLLRAMVGAYLIYLGGSLISNVVKERPENFILFAAAGVFFIAVGAVILIFGMKGYLKAKKENEEAEAREIEEEDRREAELAAWQSTVEEKEKDKLCE